MNDLISRREFVSASLTTLAATSFISNNAFAGDNSQVLTIQDVIDIIKASIPLDVSRGTVDTIKSGDASRPVTGIVTTMFATVDVIRKAAELNVNLIIAHEPTFYNHLDETEWLKEHSVYQSKAALLAKHNIVVWRFHDYIHANNPDGVLTGVLNQLGWQKYQNEERWTLSLPPVTLGEMIAHLKSKLAIQTLRFIGDSSRQCSNVVIIPGAAGGRTQINAIQKFKPDVLICGELQEWETSEYVRDARALGTQISLIVLGHVMSEEPGMEWLVSWLQPKVKDVRITHIPSQSPFQWA